VPKLVYIGGYGRSGSTLLEYILSCSEEVVACGEIASHIYKYGLIKTCTCGRAVADCPVWGGFQHGSGKLPDWNHEALTVAMLSHVSSDYAVMVDSSKTAWGSLLTPFRLRKRVVEDLLLVHLVRGPMPVCWSTVRTRHNFGPPSTAAMRCLRTALGWTLANMASALFGWCYRDQYLCFRYEDLVRSPQQVVNAIMKKTSLPPPRDLDHCGTGGNRHQLYGNSMRFNPLSQVSEDTAWKTEMPRGLKGLVWGLCWPLGVRYGYRWPSR